MQDLYYVLQIIGAVVGGVVAIGIAIGVIWFIARRSFKKEGIHQASDRLIEDEALLQPLRVAAEGYKAQVEQLERDVARLKGQHAEAISERDSARKEVQRLERLVLDQAATIARMQGDIDRLNRQVGDLGDMRSQIDDVLEKIKNSSR